jgi:hypothetical protein
MQTVIKADDGDLITVHADDLSIEQLTVRLELESPAYYGAGTFEELTLSTRHARELGRALIQCADLVERNSRRFCGTQHFDFIDTLGGRNGAQHMMIAGTEPPAGKAYRR